MTTTADDLRQATDAVARLGTCCADYEALADTEVLAGQKQIAAARRLLDTRSAWMAATIAHRSRPELGHSGLAAQQGFLSPEALIQKSTGSTKNEAYKLVAVGTMMADAEASTLNADQVFKLARRLRDSLDAAGIAAREKQAYDDRFLKVYRLGNGKVRLNGLFAPEDGEFVLSVFDSVTSPRRGGVRFVDKEKAAWSKRVQDDPRSTDQIAADAFVQLLKIAGEADQGRVFGGRRPSVRVIVTEKALTADAPVPVESAAHGQIEGSPVPISQETIDRLLCDTGTRGIQFNDTGDVINVGRDERLFTEAQRAAMGVRDGGCRWVDCDRSPAWSEAHHINDWLKDNGYTDLADGVLLCHPHHLLLHNQHWAIIRTGTEYWLRPPVDVDPGQTLIALPSKRTNP